MAIEVNAGILRETRHMNSAYLLTRDRIRLHMQVFGTGIAAYISGTAS